MSLWPYVNSLIYLTNSFLKDSCIGDNILVQIPTVVLCCLGFRPSNFNGSFPSTCYKPSLSRTSISCSRCIGWRGNLDFGYGLFLKYLNVNSLAFSSCIQYSNDFSPRTSPTPTLVRNFMFKW